MAIQRFQLVEGDPNIQQFPEGATQSFLVGDLVVLTSGLVVECNSATLTSILGVATTTGVADSNYKYIGVMVITPDQLWKCFPTSTVTPDDDLEVGKDYAIKQQAEGEGELTSTEGSAAIYYGPVRESLGKGATAGDAVLIKFDATACQGRLGN